MVGVSLLDCNISDSLAYANYWNINSHYGLSERTNKKFKKDILFPLTIIIILAVPTFFTSTKTFCKIFKSYSSEQLYKKWQ